MSCDVGEVTERSENDEVSGVSHAVRVTHNYDESNVPVEILEIRKNRNSLIQSVSYSTADEEHSVFVQKLQFYIYIFRFISTSYDANRQS